MSNFCAFCGKPLPENGICDCQAQPQYTAQPQYQPQPQYTAQPQYQPQPYPQYPEQPYPQAYQQPAQPSAVAIGFRKLGPFLKGFLTAPVDALKGAVQERDLALAMIITAFFSILSSCAWMTGIVGVHSGASAVLPFVFGLMFPLAVVALVALSAFLGGKIEKKNVSFVSALTAAGCASFLPAAIMAVAILMNLWVYSGMLMLALFICASVAVYSIVVFNVFELKRFATVMIHVGFTGLCTFVGMLLYLISIFGDMIYKMISF